MSAVDRDKPALPASTQEMLDLAIEARKRAHAPYSDFHVGAVIRTISGKLYSGCNVENAAYPEGWCAETTAIGAMVMGGDEQIAEILVIGQGDAVITPCGGCRQRIREFALPEAPIHLCRGDEVKQTVTLDDLLPLSFGPDNLEANK